MARDLAWREADVAKRIEHALVNGIADYIEEDTEAARLAPAVQAGTGLSGDWAGHDGGRRHHRDRPDRPVRPDWQVPRSWGS